MLDTPAVSFTAQWGTVGSASSTNYGQIVTGAATTAKGSWVQLLSAVENSADSYGFWLGFHGCNEAASARAVFIDIGYGVDDSATVTTVASNLWAGGCPTMTTGGMYEYFFPVFIPASARVVARCLNATSKAPHPRAPIELYGAPDRPELAKYGHVVFTYGADEASVKGVTVTAGTDSKGSWFLIGSAQANHFYIQAAYCVKAAVQNARTFTVDVATGDATNKRILVRDIMFQANTSETLGHSTGPTGKYYCTIVSGDAIYARVASRGGSPANIESVVIYGVA
jgi:hypothetical protein